MGGSFTPMDHRAHTARRSMGMLRELFPGRLVSLRGDISWPPRSPDISPPDFFLWGYLMTEMYKHRPRNLQELKDVIRQEVAAIPREVTRRTMGSFRERLRECLNNGQWGTSFNGYNFQKQVKCTK